jgi:hypothetical protein
LRRFLRQALRFVFVFANSTALHRRERITSMRTHHFAVGTREPVR